VWFVVSDTGSEITRADRARMRELLAISKQGGTHSQVTAAQCEEWRDRSETELQKDIAAGTRFCRGTVSYHVRGECKQHALETEETQ